MRIIHQHPAAESQDLHRQALAYLHRKCVQLLCAEAPQPGGRPDVRAS